MIDINDVSCKICDLPPKETCINCGSGICYSVDCCSMSIDILDNKKYKSFICTDCVTYISSTFREIISENESTNLETCAQSK